MDKMESNWIFCAGNRRSGSTVHYHYVRSLVEEAGIGRGYGGVPGGALGQKPWSILDYKDEPGVKVLRSHGPTKEVKDIIARNPDSRIIYIHRDMRDCLVSTMNREPHKGFSWFMGAWASNNIRNENYWIDTGRATLVTKYEDMIDSPIHELKRLRNFLDLDGVVSDDVLYWIYQKYHIDRVKENPSLKEAVEREGFGWAVGDGGFRPFLKRHVIHGGWGQFLETLSKEQIEQIEDKCRENLVHRGYPLYKNIQEK